MFLSDKDIAEYIDSRKIIILPEFDKKNIRPAGIRLHLGHNLLIPRDGQTIDLAGSENVQYDSATLTDSGYTLEPEKFVLGTTLERFLLPRNLIGHIDGRSTVARLGLSIHCTSAVVDGNFDEPRTVVLEIKNNGPFKLLLKPKTAVAMLILSQLTSPILQKSQSQYKGQNSVAPPNLKVQNQ